MELIPLPVKSSKLNRHKLNHQQLNNQILNNLNNNTLTVSLSNQAHLDAKKFASQQSTVEKVKQVYINTLAVYAVRDFLQWMEKVPNLTMGDSWSPIIRRFNNVADLVIPDLGKVECRPVLSGETIISLPPEVTEDRFAYVAVQFQEQLHKVQLLGFCPASDPQPEEIDIASLEPIENLIDYIDRLESADLLESALESIEDLIDYTDHLESAQLEQTFINLSQWFLDSSDVIIQSFDAIYNTNWQKLDDFISSLVGNQSPRFALGLRSSSPNPELPSESVRKAKEIVLGQNRMALIINCQQKTDEKTYIFIRLYPFLAEEIYLPSGIAIIILDESGNIFSEVQAGLTNKVLELREFRGETGERFTLKVTLKDKSFIENFVI